MEYNLLFYGNIYKKSTTSGPAVDWPLDDKKNCHPIEITGRCLQPAVIEDNNTFNPQIM